MVTGGAGHLCSSCGGHTGCSGLSWGERALQLWVGGGKEHVSRWWQGSSLEPSARGPPERRDTESLTAGRDVYTDWGWAVTASSRAMARPRARTGHLQNSFLSLVIVASGCACCVGHTVSVCAGKQCGQGLHAGFRTVGGLRPPRGSRTVSPRALWSLLAQPEACGADTSSPAAGAPPSRCRAGWVLIHMGLPSSVPVVFYFRVFPRRVYLFFTFLSM